MITTGDAAAATPAGTAWLVVDPQNNTIRWTVELTGITPTDAYIQCGDEAAAPATPAAGAAAPPAGAPAAGAATEAEGDLNLAGGEPANPLQGDAAGRDSMVGAAGIHRSHGGCGTSVCAQGKTETRYATGGFASGTDRVVAI
jgi:hypothetical protein